MPRIPKARLGRGVYHAFSRTVDDEPVLRGDDNKALLVQQLVRFLRRRRAVVYHWAVQDDGFALAVEVLDPADLAYVMGQAARRFTLLYHELHGDRRPLWAGRFRSRLVEKATYLGRLGRVLERQPVEVRQDPRLAPWEYRWSSAAAYVFGAEDPLVVPRDNPVYMAGGRNGRQRRGAWRLLLLNDETWAEDQALFALDSPHEVVGTEAFRVNARRVGGHFSARSRGRPRRVPGRTRAQRRG